MWVTMPDVRTGTPQCGLDRVISPFAQARDRLDTITGVGKRAAECMIAEIGVDMSIFPTASHLASWAGRCPGNNITGGKRRSGSPPKATAGSPTCSPSAPGRRPAVATAICPPSSGGSPATSGKKVTIAVGHSILVIAWHLLANHCDYEDLGGDYFVRRDTDRQRQRAVAQLQALGYRIVLEPVAA
jgi:transposase